MIRHQAAFEGIHPLLKGNLHCHTTRSDGVASPATTIRQYAADGYDFLALTDHRLYNYQNYAPDSGVLILPGTELDADLPVRASRFDAETSSVLHGGQRLALTATDDRSWVFASSLDGEEKGWIHVRTTEYLHEIELDGRWALENEVFSSVPYAD